MNKIGIIIGVLILLTGAVFLLFLGNIDMLVKNGIEKTVPLILKAPVKLDGVDISLLSGKGEINGLQIGNPEGYSAEYAIRVDRLTIDLDVRSVKSGIIHVKEILVDSPHIIYEGTYEKNNFSQLQTNAQAFGSSPKAAKEKSVKEKEESTSKKIQIDSVKIVNGNIGVRLKVFSPNQFTIPFPSFTVKNIGKNKEASISNAIEVVLANFNQMAIISIRPKTSAIINEIKQNGSSLRTAIENGFTKFKSLFD